MMQVHLSFFLLLSDARTLVHGFFSLSVLVIRTFYCFSYYCDSTKDSSLFPAAGEQTVPPRPPFTVDMWTNDAAVLSEAEAFEKALHLQMSQVSTLFLVEVKVVCALDRKQGALESILWGYESGSGIRSLPGATVNNDAIPILASRPHLDRFLSSARTLDLLRPVRDSLRRGGGDAGAALPQWGTGLPGEDRVLQMRNENDDVSRGAHEKGAVVEDEEVEQDEQAVGWGY
jgi:hypothetical protein